MTTKLSPSLFHDRVPLVDRPNITTFLIFTYVGGYKLIHRLLAKFNDPKTIWEAVQKEFPTATHIYRGNIYNSKKWVRSHEWKRHLPSYYRMDEDGIVFDGKKRLNAHHEILGAINCMQQNGRIWADNYVRFGQKKGDIEFYTNEAGNRAHHLSFYPETNQP